MARVLVNKWWLGLLVIASFLLWACRGATLPAATPSAQPTWAPHAVETLLAQPGCMPPAGIAPDERWIEVSLAEQVVRLRQGEGVVAEYPASTGVGISPEYVTYTGLFEVRYMYKGPIGTAPGVYVTDVLEFDPEHGNGIHSLPIDKDGLILDDRLGEPVTAGCVRVGEAAAVYDYAELGMKVWVH